MPLSRRCRRRLLLPPGWVALGFLLLLGCLLQAHWRQLQLPNVLQLTMPPLEQDTARNSLYQMYHRSTAMPYQTVAKINKLRPWHNVNFGGRPLADFLSARTIESQILAINADSAYAGGVQIRFRPDATYANLVKALDIMNITNQKKYWLDIRHQPVTLYAITDQELPRKLRPVFYGCCMCRPYFPTPTPTQSAWLLELQSLRQQSWRLPLLMLVIINVLSICKLYMNNSQGAKRLY